MQNLTGMRSWICCFGLLLPLILCACSPGRVATRELPPGDPLAAVMGQPEYLVGPGDLIRVKVFQIDDLEREVRVDNEGHVSLPLIGDVAAVGLSASQLERQITERYRNGFLQDPQVSVFIQEYNSRRVTVTGAVDEPGIYPITGALTLQQALAQAKGVSTLASRRNVIVFRTVKGEKMVARFDLSAIEKGRMPDPGIYGGDIVVVYRSDARLLLRTMLELTPFVMVWRAYR